MVESWEPLTIASLEALEKLRMRAFLTYSTVFLWILWTLLGLIQLFLTGNPFLILTSPPVGGLLFIIFKYYFR
jgi:hypothetical protein